MFVKLTALMLRTGRLICSDDCRSKSAILVRFCSNHAIGLKQEGLDRKWRPEIVYTTLSLVVCESVFPGQT